MKKKLKSDSPLRAATCSPNLSAALQWAASDGSDKDLAQRLEKLGKWGMAGDNALEIVAFEYERVIAAIREYRDAKGRYHTQKACEQLLSFLPENASVEGPADSATPQTEKGN